MFCPFTGILIFRGQLKRENKRGVLPLLPKKMSQELIVAAKQNNIALVKQLLLSGRVDVNSCDVEGRTALWWTAREGLAECAKLLLEAKANVNKVNLSGYPPLFFASYYGHVECVKLLIEWKAEVNTGPPHGDLPLPCAAVQRHLKCVEMLIQAGAELDKGNKYGNTPLALAIVQNDCDVAEFLLDKGAKLGNVRNDIEIPNWVNLLQEKRRKVIHSYLVLYGVLRRRCKIGKDMTQKVSTILWSTRFNEEWNV